MIPKIIHQVFLGQTDNLEQYPHFGENMEKWQNWAEKNGWEYNFYDKTDIINLIDNGDLLRFYINLRYNWCRIDFCRYLIINKFGGLYVDLDIAPNDGKYETLSSYIMTRDYILGLWDNKKTGKTEITNSLIGFKAGELTDLIEYSIAETKSKSQMEIYNKWKIRFFLQTTGVRMFARWCKIKKYTYDRNIYKYITDTCTATWLNNFN